MKYLILLGHLSRKDVSIVGRKAANLGELIRANFNVPRGFVITTSAYEEYIRNKREKIVKVLRTAKRDPKSLERIQSYFREEVNDDLRKEIVAAFDALKEPVVVRSSGTAEDMAGMSFAGQYLTLLNVKKKDLTKAIRRCWASLFFPGAVFYRERFGIPHDVSMAVIIQKMIDCQKSGVVFSSNPETKDRTQVVINASYGLGEGVTRGLVVPDEYVVCKNAIVKKVISEQRAMITSEGRKKVPKALRRMPVLTDAEILKIAKIAKMVERLFGSPQDIEWGLKGKRIFLFQSRAIANFK